MSGRGSAAPAPPGYALVRLIARRVPASRRAAWLAEWHSELTHAYEDGLSRGGDGFVLRVRLRARAMGALGDAGWLRRAYGAPSRGGGGAFREATRVLRRRPGFAVMVAATLALGIGAATAIFSVVDGLMLRPLPFREPERLVGIHVASGEWFLPYMDEEAADEWRAQDALFEAAHALSARSVWLTRPGEPRGLRAEMIEPGFLRMLGTPPALGREFLPQEAVPGRDDVVLLSDEIWRTVFGADRTIVGTMIHLNDEPHTVVGVMPPSVRRMPTGIPQIALPLTDPPREGTSRVLLIARLRNGVSLSLAQERMDAVAVQLDRERPRESSRGVRLVHLERSLGDDARRALVALGGAVVLLLLVACVNAAGLMLVRGAARGHDLAIRRALGASDGALFRLAFAESFVLALLAGVAGSALAWWGVRVLTALAPDTLVRFSYTPITMDLRVLAFAVITTVVVGVTFGMGPALRAARTGQLRTGHRTATSPASEARLRTYVQAAQVALAVVLLSGAGLLGRSFLALTAVDPGFESRGRFALHLSMPDFRYPDADGRAAFNLELDGRLRAIPGVLDIASIGGRTTGSGFMTVRLEAEGDAAASSEYRTLPFAQVDSAYFRVMGIELREGRTFTSADLAEGSNNVVIDADLAAHLWPGRSALGRRFRDAGDDDRYTVVGVTEDVRLGGPHDPLGPWLLFLPTSTERLRGRTIIVHATGAEAAVMRAARAAIRSLDPMIPIGELDTVDRLHAGTVQQARFLLVVMGVFAAVAILLAAIGVFGLFAFTVAGRRREFGIRMAIGARGGQILSSVLRRGLAVATAGLVLGLAGAAALARFIRSLLFDTSPADPVTALVVIAVVLLSCTAALIVPARRAAGVDAAEALRAE